MPREVSAVFMDSAFTGGYSLKNVVFALVFVFLVHGVSDVGIASMREGDSVTLHTGVEINVENRILWYLNNTGIVYLYKKKPSFFSNDSFNKKFPRLKVDPDTGDLAIIDAKATDTGSYKLIINSTERKIVNVEVSNVSASKLVEMKRNSVQEGKPVTLYPGHEGKNVIKWYFNNTRIAEISGYSSQICADDQCKERFRDRLEVDNQTGSLTITNTRTTDSGLYEVQIILSSNSFSITKVEKFDLNVTAIVSAIFPVLGVCGVCGCVLVIGIIWYFKPWESRNAEKRQNVQSDLQHVEVAQDDEDSILNQPRGPKLNQTEDKTELLSEQ